MGSQRSRAHAALVTAAVNLRCHSQERLAPHEQRAYTLRSVDLVAGDAHEINVVAAHVDVDLADALGGVGVERYAPLAADRAYGADIVDHADLVVRMHDRNDGGIRVYGVGDRLGPDDAPGVRLDIGHSHSQGLQVGAGIEHRLVFVRGGDDALAAGGFDHALDRQVVRLGRARCPHYLAGIRVEQRGDMRAGLFDQFLGFPAVRMAARRGIAERAVGEQARTHALRHARVYGRRGRIVQINGPGRDLGRHIEILPERQCDRAECPRLSAARRARAWADQSIWALIRFFGSCRRAMVRMSRRSTSDANVMRFRNKSICCERSAQSSWVRQISPS